MIIDTHAHILPQSTLDELNNQTKKFPSIELLTKDDKFQLSFNQKAPTRPIMPKLRSIEARNQFLVQNRIDLQLSGGWLDSFGYEVNAEEGAEWSRFLNEGMISECEKNKVVIPLATVPLQSGKHAAAVLEEAVKMGMPGAMIGTQPRGSSGNLDENSIFYLMTRGISREEAKKILIKGFLNDSVETITNNEIKKFLFEKLDKKLNEYR